MLSEHSSFGNKLEKLSTNFVVTNLSKPTVKFSQFLFFFVCAPAALNIEVKLPMLVA